MVSRRRCIPALLATLISLGIGRSEAAETPKPDEGSVKVSTTVDWTSKYYYRGIPQEDGGLILQPGVEVGWDLCRGAGLLGPVTLTAGVWNSFHTGDTGSDGGDATHDPSAWYESDLYLKLATKFWGVLGLGTSYIAYMSPNGAFATIHELGFTLSYDDAPFFSGLVGDRFGGLQPSITLAVELDGTGLGDSEGVYLGFGLAPTIEVFDVSVLSMTAGLPLELGFGLDDDYFGDPVSGDSDALGFFSAKAELSFGLGFMPARLGEWTLALRAQVFVLGEVLERVNGGDHAEVIFGVGLTNSFPGS